jgi:hypothetical protein
MRRPKYQREPTELREVIWRQGLITPWQLLRIASWKSARSLAHLSLNNPADIEAATGAALTAASPFRTARRPRLTGRFWEATGEAVGYLDRLHGVNLAMGSAVLCIANPRVWPVVDRWAAQRLFGTRVVSSPAFYMAYITRLSLLLPKGPEAPTIHELDQDVSNGEVEVEAVDWRSLLP